MSSKLKNYFSDFIFGSIDGLVTTFAVVSGVIGAGLSTTIILILGFANLFADGFSMAASNYLSTKSENDMGQSDKNALGAALATFFAFVIIGFVPLVSFLINFKEFNYQATIIFTATAFTIIGYIKGVITGKNRLISATQTLIIGALAAFIAYYVGYFISIIVG